MKILTVLGARPQFVKASMVSLALREQGKAGFQEVIVHTGQHFDSNMSAIFFDEMRIPEPDYDLGIASLAHGAMTGRMLEAVENVLEKERPDLVLVYGDTNSTLAGALAAAKLNISIGHVEAGLRSFNRRMPEEINRVVADQLSELLFAPTTTAVQNLEREGIAKERIRVVGDVMYDASLFFARIAQEKSNLLQTLGVKPEEYALTTVHRAENTDDEERLEAVCHRLRELSHNLPVVLPLHPRTRGMLERSGFFRLLSDETITIEPVGYLDMLLLEKHAKVIVTDSGGVQKEAFFYRVPCITLRNETEWVELVDLGWNRLVPTMDQGRFSESIEWAFRFDRRTPRSTSLYGDGRASEAIAEALGNYQTE
ncbi:MAG TPA: UDP-N-acetylglucosamine 2-epimerase (non-hydrolyzing) [Pyrinomonadaceae bacterium]|nr:UDP-N-acetylglucosamine 2-epimerase (non-hydrolyzing) [Pyrinomonadaceae bacterium]